MEKVVYLGIIEEEIENLPGLYEWCEKEVDDDEQQNLALQLTRQHHPLRMVFVALTQLPTVLPRAEGTNCEQKGKLYIHINNHKIHNGPPTV